MREILSAQPSLEKLYETFEEDYKKTRKEKGPLDALLELRASLSPYQERDLKGIVEKLQKHALEELDLLGEVRPEDAEKVHLKKAIGGQLSDYRQAIEKWENNQKLKVSAARRQTRRKGRPKIY